MKKTVWIFSLAVAGRVFSAEPPPCPGIESWEFRNELARPEQLEPVSTGDVVFVRGKVEGYESYRIDVDSKGKVVITTEDDEGLRRAVYYYQDRVRAGDLESCVRKPWVKNRIARCFFGPIKRPPLYHDELMDDIDYYPRSYLERLAREGINGLWLTVEWQDLAETSFTRRSKDAQKRLAKLRRTVDRCLEYGIKTWIFCIEPLSPRTGSASGNSSENIFNTHPELFNGYVMCTSLPESQRYIEESVKDIFTQVPRLGGMIMISHGERPTTCLSLVSPVTGERSRSCPRCDKLEPWQIHRNTSEAIVRGIRAAGSDAEYISWFYQPHVRPERASWVPEVARHVPEGVVMAYNFESGAIKDQLGRFRNGGDYWLSYVGPATGFKSFADAGKTAGASIGAKIQVGNSHEVATVPFVPVPGLLYRKYKAMREMGVSTVLQCWYFGNYPGVMNKAAGELSFDDFSENENEFLLKLARPVWKEDAEKISKVWKRFSDAYAEYPLSNDMQYYGPFHAGLSWPLLADVELKPLGSTWMPKDPPSGDTIGECLENHTIEEAALLASRMAKGVRVLDAEGEDLLDALAVKWRGDKARMRDIGVMKALEYHFMSGSNILGFYHDRAKALYLSRKVGDGKGALAALKRMDAAVVREEELTRRILPIAEDDSRIGFHSEAEAHQYHPAKLRWRLGELARTRSRIAEISAALGRGDEYPLSDFELKAPSCRTGEFVSYPGGRFRVYIEENGDYTFEVEMKKSDTVVFCTLDAAGVSWYRQLIVTGGGAVVPTGGWNCVTPCHEVVASSVEEKAGKSTVKFTISSLAWGSRDDRRPEWIMVKRGHEQLWPATPQDKRYSANRLNIGIMQGYRFGRLIETGRDKSSALADSRDVAWGQAPKSVLKTPCYSYILRNYRQNGRE